MRKFVDTVLNFIWKILGGIAGIFAGIAIISNFLFTPKLFQKFAKLFPIMFSKKLFIILLLILIVLAVGIFAWQYFSAPKNETANWKIYKDEEYGVEFKYPQDYDHKESSVNPVVYFYQPPLTTQYDPDMFFSVQNEPMALLFYGTFGIVPREDAINSSATLDSSKDVIINSIRWQKEVWSLQVGLKVISYYTKYKDKYYTIAIGANQSSYSEKEKIISQILSTFEFLE